MKKFLFVLLFLPLFVGATKYYCAPTTNSPSGNDNNPGTISSPFFSLNKAWIAILAGDTIYMRGGTYVYNQPQILRFIDGTSGNLIKIWAYPNETPVITKGSSFDYSNQPGPNGSGYGIGVSGIYFQNVSYVEIDGLEISGYTQPNGDTQVWKGFFGYNINHCNFKNLKIHGNCLGMAISHYSSDNLILNCDFYNNKDLYSSPAYNNGDGLDISQMETVDSGSPFGGTFQNNANNVNTVMGCRFWDNADDGVDFFKNDGYVTIENSWSWHNGYAIDNTSIGGDGNGFKLGRAALTNTIKRTVINCLSFNNRMRGFDENANFEVSPAATCAMALYNNTSYSNGGRGFDFWQGAVPHVIRNNVAFNDSNIPIFLSQTIVDHNTFLQNGNPNPAVTLTNADFVSVNSTGMDGARQSDGSLPVLTFLHLAAGSDLIDAGTSVGLPYNGLAPDIGAFETGLLHGLRFVKQNGHFIKVNGKFVKY